MTHETSVANYRVLMVTSWVSTPGRNDMRVAMALKLRTALGLKAGDLAALIDENDGNLDASTIAERLRAFLRTRPRKT